MRENIKNLIAFLAQNIDFPEPIVEIGSYQVEGQEGFADISPFFPNKEFIGCDMRMGPGVDRIENLERLTFEAESIGTIFMLETLEHVAPLQKGMEEVYRVLKSGGWLVISSAMDFPVHEYPSDYWRFTPKGFEYLLKDFFLQKVFFQGPSFFPHTVIGIGRKGKLEEEIPLPFLEGWAEIGKKNENIEEYPAKSFFEALEKIESIFNSRSWRITAPLRWIHKKLIVRKGLPK